MRLCFHLFAAASCLAWMAIPTMSAPAEPAPRHDDGLTRRSPHAEIPVVPVANLTVEHGYAVWNKTIALLEAHLNGWYTFNQNQGLRNELLSFGPANIIREARDLVHLSEAFFRASPQNSTSSLCDAASNLQLVPKQFAKVIIKVVEVRKKLETEPHRIREAVDAAKRELAAVDQLGAKKDEAMRLARELSGDVALSWCPTVEHDKPVPPPYEVCHMNGKYIPLALMFPWLLALVRQCHHETPPDPFDVDCGREKKRLTKDISDKIQHLQDQAGKVWRPELVDRLEAHRKKPEAKKVRDGMNTLLSKLQSASAKLATRIKDCDGTGTNGTVSDGDDDSGDED